MLKPYRPLRSRFARLLASALVVASLLGNGLALAQAAAPIKKHCCGQATGHVARGGCADAGKPCPTPYAACDDACPMGSTAMPALPVMAAAMIFPVPATIALPPLFAGQWPATDPGPGLRPPISA
jgi:hypothetical protein